MEKKIRLIDIYDVEPPSRHGAYGYDTRLIWYAVTQVKANPFKTRDIQRYIEKLGVKLGNRKISSEINKFVQHGHLKREPIENDTAKYQYYVEAHR